MKMSRRSLLRLSGTSAVALLAAACAPGRPASADGRTCQAAEAQPAEPAKPAEAAKPAEPAKPARPPSLPKQAGGASRCSGREATAPAAAKPAEAAKPAAAGGDIRAKWEAELPEGPGRGRLLARHRRHDEQAVHRDVHRRTTRSCGRTTPSRKRSVPSLDQKVLVALATDTAPDMFTLNAGTIQTFMAKKALSPVPAAAWGAATIDEMLSKYYLPNVMKILMTDGNLYGIPNQMNAQQHDDQHPDVQGGGPRSGEGFPEDLGRRRRAQPEADQARGQSADPEGVRVPLGAAGPGQQRAPVADPAVRRRDPAGRRHAGLQQRGRRQGHDDVPRRRGGSEGDPDLADLTGAGLRDGAERDAPDGAERRHVHRVRQPEDEGQLHLRSRCRRSTRPSRSGSLRRTTWW